MGALRRRGRPCPVAPGREIHGSLCSPPASSRSRPRDATGRRDRPTRQAKMEYAAPTASASRVCGPSLGRPILRPPRARAPGSDRAQPGGLAAPASHPADHAESTEPLQPAGRHVPVDWPRAADDARARTDLARTGSAADRREVPGGHLDLPYPGPAPTPVQRPAGPNGASRTDPSRRVHEGRRPGRAGNRVPGRRPLAAGPTVATRTPIRDSLTLHGFHAPAPASGRCGGCLVSAPVRPAPGAGFALRQRTTSRARRRLAGSGACAGGISPAPSHQIRRTKSGLDVAESAGSG